MFTKIIGVAAVIIGLGMNLGHAADNPPVLQQQPGYVDWGGFNWGLGIATNFDIGGGRVNNAVPVNNIVRVDDSSSNVGIGFVLEAYYFLRTSFFGLAGGAGCNPNDPRAAPELPSQLRDQNVQLEYRGWLARQS